MAIVGEALLETFGSSVLLSYFSRSLKVIRTDRDQSATYDFLLVVHSNCGPIFYHFWYR